MRGTPSQVGEALRIRVPKEIAMRTNELVFQVTAKAHGALVAKTPVDTGYLVNGLSLTVNGESAPKQPKRDANARYGMPVFDGMAIPRALAAGKSLLLAFQATYAPYVEDSRHMVKRTKAQMTGIVRDAIIVIKGRYK
jgi:hypothetical protein